VELIARKLLSGQEVASHQRILVRALTWNLFSGRDFPPNEALRTWRSRLLRTTETDATHAQVNRLLLDEFAGWLAAREWDVALLQEAPPSWLRPLGQRCRASGAIALTSRNTLAFARAALARWSPDLIASNGGGSNQLLARAPARMAAPRRLTLTPWPERRRMLFARIQLAGGRTICVANLHASAGDPAAAERDALAAAATATEWAGDDPLILGGDLNLRPRQSPGAFRALEERYGLAPPTGPRSLDHLLARDLEVVEAPAPLPPEERELALPEGLIRLSDHAPVAAAFGMT
jgi:endonuclease/exonuclease/phosphatase family metal-dependent hydrolase